MTLWGSIRQEVCVAVTNWGHVAVAKWGHVAVCVRLTVRMQW